MAAGLLLGAQGCGSGSGSGSGGGGVLSCDIVQGGEHYCEEAKSNGSSASSGCPSMTGYTPGTGCSQDGVTATCTQGAYTFYVYGGASATATLMSLCPGGGTGGSGGGAGSGGGGTGNGGGGGSSGGNGLSGTGTYLECDAVDSTGTVGCEENTFPAQPYSNVTCDFGTLFGPTNYSTTAHCSVPTGPGFSCSATYEGYDVNGYWTNPNWSDPANQAELQSNYSIYKSLCAALSGTFTTYGVTVGTNGMVSAND